MNNKNLRLIVGLGNFDKKYKDTRHNIGFVFVDSLAKKFGVKKWQSNEKIEAETAEAKIELTKKFKFKALLAKPLLFVNNSGLVVKKLKNFYKTKVDDIIIIHDDLDIPFGKVKLSYDTGAAGHKGVESITKALGTQKFYRLRIGTSNKILEKARKIKSDKKRMGLILEFVVKPFTKKEKSALK